MQRANSLGKILMLGKIEGRRKRGRQRMRWLMASLPQWTWVWVDSGSWWWTGKPSVLQSMGSQRVGHNWGTELNWYFSNVRGRGANYYLTQISLELVEERKWSWPVILPGSPFQTPSMNHFHSFAHFFNLASVSPTPRKQNSRSSSSKDLSGLQDFVERPGGRGHSCLVPHPQGKHSSITSVTMMFALGVCRCSLLRKSPPIPIFWVFIISGIMSNAFYALISIVMSFSSQPVNVVDCLNGFSNIAPSPNVWNKHCLVMGYNSFSLGSSSYSHHPLINILLRIFSVYSRDIESVV